MKYFCIVILISLTACAQINPLTGGPDDITSPKIDSAKTFPYNGQTNFDGEIVHIEFDEYIILNKPNDNIIITPRPSISPIITSHNKTLEIKLIDPLETNTTYTISFNHAISDITEKNDSIFQYVFSTGDYIDSLELSGTVTDAFTNKGTKNYLIALYPLATEGDFDSIPYKTKPTYIGQTNSEGSFELNYLKEGEYYVFAIEDKNKNLLLEPGEKIGFLLQKSIVINNDTKKVIIKSFLEETSKSKISRVTFSAPAKLELIFTSPVDSFSISTTCELLKEKTGANDSLIFWLAQNPTAKMRFAIDLNGELDTLKPLFKTSSETARSLQMNNNVINAKVLPNEFLELTLSEPIDSSGVDSSKIKVMKTDSTFLQPEIEINNLRTVVFKNRDTKPLIITIDSAAFTSIYGTINITPQKIIFETQPISFYGSLTVNTDSVFENPCIVYLLNAQGIPIDTAIYSKQIVFENIVPGDYQLQLIIDSDRSGDWTTGSLKETRVPEKVIYFNGLISIKSKWEMEVDWLLNEENLD